MKANYNRTLQQIHDDGLWPDAGLMRPDPEQSTRHYAIMEVLRSLPAEDYERLKGFFLLTESNAHELARIAREASGMVPPSKLQRPSAESGNRGRLASSEDAVFSCPSFQYQRRS